MRDEHLTEEQLNDYVDGRLGSTDRRMAEGHLPDCADCSDAVAEIRSLLELAAELPELRPSRELLPGIHNRIGARRAARTRWIGLAASIVLLTTVGAGLLMQGRTDPVGATGGATTPEVQLAQPAAHVSAAGDLEQEFREAERAFFEAGDALLKIIEKRRAEMPDETLAVFEENLAILDAAIRDVRSTMGDDAGRVGNGQTLTALHHKRMQLLWKTSRLSS